MSYIKVVVDEGSAQVKVCWFDEQLHTRTLPSRVVQDAKVEASGDYVASAYRVNGYEFTVDSTMDQTIRTDNTRYQTSEVNRVLIHEALRQAGFGGQNVEVITTLPIGNFFGIKPVNQPLIKQKKQNVKGDIENLAGESLAIIKNCKVSPEAIPAWYDVALNEQGQWQSDFENSRRILIVDIGGTTTDISLITGDGALERFISIAHGVFEIAENLQNRLLTNPDLQLRHIGPANLDFALRNQSLRNVNIQKEIAQSSHPVIHHILNEMLSFAPDANDIDHIIYVGGGSALIGKELSNQYGGHTIIPEKPELAIARGLVKSQQQQSRKEV